MTPRCIHRTWTHAFLPRLAPYAVLFIALGLSCLNTTGSPKPHSQLPDYATETYTTIPSLW